MAKKQLTVEQFNALSKAEQKVMVAQDVIAQLQAKKYKGNTGSYIDRIQLTGKNIWRAQGDDIQENFDKIKSCHVCGIGACIMSITKFKNKLTFGDIDAGASGMSMSTHRLLKSVFTIKEMTWIEGLFEGGNTNYVGMVYDEYPLTYNDIDNCMLFKNRNKSANKRLELIMQNIIDNKGRLVPNKLFN